MAASAGARAGRRAARAGARAGEPSRRARLHVFITWPDDGTVLPRRRTTGRARRGPARSWSSAAIRATSSPRRRTRRGGLRESSPSRRRGRPGSRGRGERRLGREQVAEARRLEQVAASAVLDEAELGEDRSRLGVARGMRASATRLRAIRAARGTAGPSRKIRRTTSCGATVPFQWFSSSRNATS